MSADRLPCPPGGDPHRLVVIAVRAAGGERVPEPEAVASRHAVGDVREGRRALVRRHDQVGILAVVADHPIGRADLVTAVVVGEVEQPAEEQLVTGDRLLGERLPPAVARGALEHEAALGAHGHDERVLHHLRLHQPEHLGPEVLQAVRPAQAAARHLAAAQVHPLEARRVDEDLEARPGLGQHGDALGLELERHVRATARWELALVAPHVIGAEEARAQNRLHDGEEAAQDPVLVEAPDGVDRLADLLRQRLGAGVVTTVGVEPGVKQRHEQARDVGVGEQRPGDVGAGIGDRRLAEVAGDGADDRDLAAGHPRGQHEAVQPVVLEPPAAHVDERPLEGLLDRRQILWRAAQAEVVDPGRVAAHGGDPVWPLVDHAGAHVLEGRHHL